MSNKRRWKNESEAKPDESAGAVWGEDDDAAATVHPPEAESTKAEAAGTDHSSEEIPAAEPTGTSDSATASSGTTYEPADELASSQAGAGIAEATAGASTLPTEAAPRDASTSPTDEFDVLGAEVADVLRHTREVADRVRADAEEQARTITVEAEQHAEATIAEAEQQARDHRAEAERESEEQRAEVARQLDEAASVLEAAAARDLKLRSESEKHLAEAVAARDEGRAMLEHATERLNRADTVAQELAAQIEAARVEVAPLAAELQGLAEQYRAVVLKEKTATAHLGGAADDPSVIDLRDSSEASGPSPDEAPAEPAADATIGHPDTGGDPPSLT